MIKDFVRGINIALGFIFTLGLLFGVAYAVGFHSANEILGGTFIGNYSFMNGNVGIGTSSPNVDLEISNNGSNEDAYLRITGSGNDNAAGLSLQNVRSAEEWQITIRNSSNDNLWISGYNSSSWVTSLVLEQSSGYVGIGVTDPYSVLDLGQGDLTFRTVDTGTNYCQVYSRLNGCLSDGRSVQIASSAGVEFCVKCY